MRKNYKQQEGLWIGKKYVKDGKTGVLCCKYIFVTLEVCFRLFPSIRQVAVSSTCPQGQLKHWNNPE